MPPTNQHITKHELFEELNAEELSLLSDCIQKIKTHVDKPIHHSKDAGQLARLLVFRKYLTF